MHPTLLLHGWCGQPNSNWFPWLKKEIEFKVDELYIPTLPCTKNPVKEEQMNYINIYASDLKSGSNIIAHSLGCKLALHFIEKHNITQSNIILVAPTYPHLEKEHGGDVFGESLIYLKKYFNTPLNIEKINTLGNKIIILLSNDDPYINMENAKKYYSHFDNIEFIYCKNKGHFTTKKHIIELPEILEHLS